MIFSVILRAVRRRSKTAPVHGSATREVFISRTTKNRLAQKIGPFMMVIIEESQK
jgi:hypothetical protein